MKNSPRGGGAKKAGQTYAKRVPLADAIKIAGSWEVLIKDIPKETWRTWKKEPPSVPADRVIDHLMRWWKSREALIEEARREARRELAEQWGMVPVEDLERPDEEPPRERASGR